MGFEDNRFDGNVDEELRCSICRNIIEDPIGTECEHNFCKICIYQWLQTQSSCPVDRKPLTIPQLCEPSRIFRSFYSKLIIKCEFESNGCGVKSMIEDINSHQNECKFNLNIKRECEKGCEAVLHYKEFVKYLKSINKKLMEDLIKVEITKEEVIKDYERQLTIERNENEELKQQIVVLSQPSRIDEMMFERFSSSLSRVKIVNWGRINTNPNAIKKNSIISALKNPNIPMIIIEILVENSCEKHWPLGLRSSEMRANNQTFFNQYVFRKVPKLQAVIVFSCDNRHMSENMIKVPGFVIIFGF